MAGLEPKTDKDYEIDNAADTLMRAAEIEQDAALHKAAVKRLKQRKEALDKILRQE